MFLNSDWVVSTAFVGEVVSKNHALPSMHIANASDYVPRGHALIETSELSECQPWRALIQKLANAITSVILVSLE